MTRKHYRTRNYKTTPTVEITLLGLWRTICHIPNTGVYKIDNPINLPVSLVIVTIVHWYKIIIRTQYVVGVKCLLDTLTKYILRIVILQK